MDGFQRVQWYFSFSLPQNCLTGQGRGKDWSRGGVGGGERIEEPAKMQVLRLYQQILI